MQAGKDNEAKGETMKINMVLWDGKRNEIAPLERSARSDDTLRGVVGNSGGGQ
jgi:hypothetical protein